MKIQAHELSVPSEILTEPKLPSTFCTNHHPSVDLAFPITLSVSPSVMLDCPGSFLCNFNPPFCVEKL